jgi:hypothetical protein
MRSATDLHIGRLILAGIYSYGIPFELELEALKLEAWRKPDL